MSQKKPTSFLSSGKCHNTTASMEWWPFAARLRTHIPPPDWHPTAHSLSPIPQPPLRPHRGWATHLERSIAPAQGFIPLRHGNTWGNLAEAHAGLIEQVTISNLAQPSVVVTQLFRAFLARLSFPLESPYSGCPRGLSPLPRGAPELSVPFVWWLSPRTNRSHAIACVL